MRNVSFLQELMSTVAEQGRALLPWVLGGADDDIELLSQALVSGRGEASGVVLAREIVNRYRSLDADERLAYFKFLAQSFLPDPETARAAAVAWLKEPSPATLSVLQAAIDSPRQEFFRRLNLAPGATGEIVKLRQDLLKLLRAHPELAVVDADLKHLLGSWFNRGFLVLRRIDWQTPAAILEKIIAYEAVHKIESWDDLRRRLDPTDRRCFAFFHPSLVDEPLIFVEVALTGDMPHSIRDVLDEERKDGAAEEAPTTAVFYSISNCQEGLKGISFGNFLIKQVAEELAREQPALKTFVTLSPVPGFGRWLDRQMTDPHNGLTTAESDALRLLQQPDWQRKESAPLKAALNAMAAQYFLAEKNDDGRPIDPVARFHLGNGARLERINWLGDASAKGLRESYGLMVNYRYELKDIERNHEAYANEGVVTASKAVRALLKTRERPKAPSALKLPAPDPVRT